MNLSWTIWTPVVLESLLFFLLVTLKDPIVYISSALVSRYWRHGEAVLEGKFNEVNINNILNCW